MSSYDARIRERTVSLEGRGLLLSVVRGEKINGTSLRSRELWRRRPKSQRTRLNNRETTKEESSKGGRCGHEIGWLV